MSDTEPDVEEQAITTRTKDHLGRALVNIATDARDHVGRATTATVDYLGRTLVA